jgi:hypothetical protein
MGKGKEMRMERTRCNTTIAEFHSLRLITESPNRNSDSNEQIESV